MATTVDVDYLSAYLGVPHQTLSSVVDAPTAQLIQSVLDAVTVRAKEHDELAADKLRVDIELENAVRSSETRTEGLRSNLEKSQRTVEEVRIKLKEEGKEVLTWSILKLFANYTQKMRGQLLKANSKH